MIPIFYKLYYCHYKASIQFSPGPFTLGRWSPVVNTIAVLWTIFVSAIVVSPTMNPVTWENMNYSVSAKPVLLKYPIAKIFKIASNHIYCDSDCYNLVPF
jgi:hypothetical protein